MRAAVCCAAAAPCQTEGAQLPLIVKHQHETER